MLGIHAELYSELLKPRHLESFHAPELHFRASDERRRLLETMTQTHTFDPFPEVDKQHQPRLPVMKAAWTTTYKRW